MTETKTTNAGISLRPTANLGALVFVLAVMWYAASSQNNAAAYLLLFALTAVFLVSIPHTWLNLASLKAATESAKPAFAGQEVSIPVEITNRARAPRRGLTVSLVNSDGVRETIDAIPAEKAARVTLRFSVQVRGEHRLGPLCLGSIYPLGWLEARRQIDATQRYLVYPKPAGDRTLPGNSHARSSAARQEIGEGDDFSGVRPYLLGESQRHIDWKAVARGQEMMTKQFIAESDGLLYLDYDRVPLRTTEERLSQIALWVIEAERTQIPYGLRLPNEEVAPALGDAHFHRCLRALALFR